MKPIFSIIVPAYNVAAYLPAALDSVQAQDVAAWECLCVDDGSTDGTAEVLQRYAATDARFRLFRQENAGVSVARNRALQEVKGEWILFLDGDDLLAPGLLSALQRATDTTPPTCLRAIWSPSGTATSRKTKPLLGHPSVTLAATMKRAVVFLVKSFGPSSGRGPIVLNWPNAIAS